MRVVRILAAAVEEAAEAAAWYEKERSGLGDDSQHAIEAALDILEQDIVPLTPAPGASGASGAQSVKRLILRRFPYAVILHERNTEILVIAFAHHSRRPGYWRDRVRA